MKNKFKLYKAYWSMTKPGIMMMVLVTTALGFYFAGRGIQDSVLLLWTLLGSGLTCGGASVLNQYLERDVDAIMRRTQNRPIPTGIIAPEDALTFGLALILSGLFVFCWKVNLLTAFLSLLTCFLYVLVYTPMKKLTWLNTSFGAIPGAIPPLGGWAAATDHLAPGGWILFLIMFTWQHPHFYSIAWLLKDDYKKAGFKMLPVVHPDAKYTLVQITAFSFLLTAFSLMPSLAGMSGKIYFWGALGLGIGVLYTAFLFQHNQSDANARKILGASIMYLPLLLVLIIVDGALS
ncbi:MAG: heme o synthase [Candidatus Omnitrophica bacterium]|nr:heme o synthase [Candidatus Omnitrophota bacterium]MDE2009726.1 heme o synthase [Candidatus Omnitrophota bacterium]MDE2213877.1 heme o synthase [Candidatus Omnitrophota bacterium]MDE2231864.1 heme o synthase [Candidatus Omnitrophota bacterium]